MSEIDQIQKRNPHNSNILPHSHPLWHNSHLPLFPPSPSPPRPFPPHLLPLENPRDHPGGQHDADAGIANTNSPSAISRSKLRVGARPKCAYISCVISGYKLLRTQQIVISKLNPTREDTTANQFRPNHHPYSTTLLKVPPSLQT
jgi:hypothetical protein